MSEIRPSSGSQGAIPGDLSRTPRTPLAPRRGRVASRGLAGATALLTLFAVGCTGSKSGDTPGTAVASVDAAALKPFYEQKIDWKACEPAVADFQCGRLKVPLDYSNPGGEQIELALTRTPATNPSQKIGSLVLNPGGPGGSGVQYAQAAESVLTPRLRSRFDVVGFDPRGVGGSTSIRCLPDKQMDAYVRVDQTPDDQAEVTQYVDTTKGFAVACKDNSGKLIGHVSTAEATRDMDVLRAALGDPKLYYLGKSYGTSLGAVYAEQFPDKVGRFVLDGAIDPRVNSLDAARAQAAGFELALDAFLTDCVARSDCPLGTDKTTARQRLADLLKRTDSKPLPGDGTRTVNEPLATIGVIAALYDKATWPLLRQALTQANAGSGELLLVFADSYFQRNATGHYDNTMAANAAINCLDSPPAARTIEDVEKQKDAFRKASPIFGETLAWAGLSCTYWPVSPVGKPHEIKAAGAAPIVVVGTTRDPATPYSWAEGLASQLDSGVLLTYDGDGHTAYMRGEGTSCIDDAVDAYFIDGRVPQDGMRCK